MGALLGAILSVAGNTLSLLTEKEKSKNNPQKRTVELAAKIAELSRQYDEEINREEDTVSNAELDAFTRELCLTLSEIAAVSRVS